MNPGFQLVKLTKVTIVLAVIKVQVQPKTYKSWVLVPKFDSASTELLLPNMANKEEDPNIIKALNDEDSDNCPDAGPQNPAEAQTYTNKIIKVFDTFSNLIHQDNKDALPKTIQNLKILMAKHWDLMGQADLEVVIRTIIDPGCLHLQQHVTREGPKVVDLVKDVPEAWKFIHELPKKQQRREEKEIMVSIFDHTSEALAHLSTTAAHFSSLAKIMDRDTLHLVMNAAIQPLVQLNLPEKFLNPVADAVPLTTEEQMRAKVERTILLRHNVACMVHEPRNGPTHILTAVVWLKLRTKFFNQGTTKEACELFNMRVKQLSHVIMGKRYLRGMQKKGPKE